MNRTSVQAQHTAVPTILLDAARYLTHQGWFQGARYDPDDPVACPAACAWGAIYMAVTGRRQGATAAQWHDINEATEVLARHLGMPEDWEQAEDAIAFVTDWNDEAGRTAAEVITALTDAATTNRTAAAVPGGAR